ncbi:MAG: phosphoglycerate dehydrogenase [Sandaracinaceae bacterium]|nr:phosphoglycerate dehydrogenase [Sandaracinaceae bacterium]
MRGVTHQGRILLLEGIDPGAKTNLEAAGWRVDLYPQALGEADLVAEIGDVVALGLRSKTHVTPRVLEAAKELRTIGAFCIGTNQIALEAAHRHGVPVFNAPFSNTRSVAELVMAEIVFLARKLGDRSREMHQGIWKKTAQGCHEVRGKTLGIIGYGHIGRQVGVLAEAFGMNVQFHDIASQLPMGNNTPAAGGLDEVLGTSDFVTLHVPATPQTKNMIGAAEIAKMAPGSHLLNLSRGNVVIIEALADALRSGHLAGAAIDVYPHEPKTNDEPFESPLQNLPNVILSPHIGGSTLEAQVSIGSEVSAKLAQFLGRGTTATSVNFPEADLPVRAGAVRIQHLHRNVPGVLGDVHRIAAAHGRNVLGQVLVTDTEVGYLLMDIGGEGGEDVVHDIAKLDTTIRARLLY